MMDGVRAIVLVGLMGAGKTTAGRLVAEWLGWPFLDTDAVLEERHGRTAREIGAESGTVDLHAREARHLLDALAGPAGVVVAAAASVVDEPACRRALRRPGVLVALLRADPEVLARRFAAQAHRPRYGPDAVAFLAAQGAHRRRRFAAVRPVVTIDTGRLDAGATADRVLAAVGSRETAEPEPASRQDRARIGP